MADFLSTRDMGSDIVERLAEGDTSSANVDFIMEKLERALPCMSNDMDVVQNSIKTALSRARGVGEKITGVRREIERAVFQKHLLPLFSILSMPSVETAMFDRPQRTSFLALRYQKKGREGVAAQLQKDGAEFEEIPWCSDGVSIAQVPIRFPWGAYKSSVKYPNANPSVYESDATRMIPSVLATAHIHGHADVLDMCAALGGISIGLLNALSTHGGHLISNDRDTRRAAGLQNILEVHHARESGAKSTVMNCDAEHLVMRYPEQFDAISCDPSSSGLANLGRDKGPWDISSSERIARCALEQRRLLQGAIHALKVNGRAVYSVETFTVEECERVVSDVLQHFRGAVRALDPMRDISGTGHWDLEPALQLSEKVQDHLCMEHFPALRLSPEIFGGRSRGGFVACIEKTAST